MNHFYFIKLALFNLIGLALAGEIRISNVFNRDEGREQRELYEKIYSEREQTLTPSETLDLLKSLIQIVKDDKDEEWILKRKHALDLVELCKVTSKKCDDYYRVFEDSLNTLKDESKYPNIIACLRYHIKEQFFVCRDKLREKLELTVNKIPEGYSDKLKILKETVTEATKERPSELFREAYEEDLPEAVLDYMEEVRGPFGVDIVYSTYGEAEYGMLVKRLLRLPCLEVVLRIFPVIRIYNLLSFDRETLVEFDSLEREWLENYNVCSVIMNNGRSSIDELIRESFGLLSSRFPKLEPEDKDEVKLVPKPKVPWITRCAGCLGLDERV